MASRAANATIKGYYYQFDTSILKLLELPDDSDGITVEGIEDIDISTATENTAVQCKYLSKPKFINSAVRDPIILMLDHFVNSNSPINYVLYAHFQEEAGGQEKTISLSLLKDILTYTESKIPKCYYVDNRITDNQLTLFLSKFKFVFGQEFEIQQLEVIRKLQSKFSCSELEADYMFYNNALRVIIDTAKLEDDAQRYIKKSDFFSAIDKHKILFNEWYIRLRSKADFLKQLSIIISKTGANDPTKNKLIFIEKKILDVDDGDYNLLTFIENLLHKYYRMGHSLRNAKPITLILDLTLDSIIEIKKTLIKNLISFNDGHEGIYFNDIAFNADPILNVTGNRNKISKSSFSIKIITKTTFEAYISLITKPKVVFHFSGETCPYTRDLNYQIFDVKYCENLKDIANLIL